MTKMVDAAHTSDDVSVQIPSSDAGNGSSLHETTELTVRINANPKLSYLDGLRGILCLVVVFSHSILMGKSNHEQTFSIFFRPWIHHSPLRLLVAGEFAVAGFFVLSGCVLVRRYFEYSDNGTILISGLIRRFPRLFIPSTVAMFVYYAVLHFRPWYGFNECHEIGEGSVETAKIGMGYVLLNSFGQYLWMPALYTIQWTMQVEFICSIFVYGLAFLVTRHKIRQYRIIIYVVLIFILPIAWLASHGRIPRIVQYIQPFIFGLLLSDLDASGFLNRLHTTKAYLSMLVNGSLLVLTIYFGSYPVFNTDVVNGSGTLWSPFGWMFGWFWISFGGFCLLLLALICKPFQNFLSTKPVHLLGKISFGIYLTHYIILCLVDVSFTKWTAPYLGRDLAVVIGLIFLTLPITLLASYAFYLFVDAPAVHISHWIYFTIFGRCSKLTMRPKPLQRRIWIVLLSVVLVSILISVIPARQGNGSCSNHSFENVTTVTSSP
jgi:peptidoglycan/LPS O-acetylase OafA/YrhL